MIRLFTDTDDPSFATSCFSALLQLLIPTKIHHASLLTMATATALDKADAETKCGVKDYSKTIM